MGILYEKKNHIAYVTIDNPEKGNIFDHQTSNDISEVWKEIWEDWDVRVAILTGSGERHLCAGHNLAPPPGVSEDDRERIRTESVFWPLAGTVNGANIGADGRLGDHYPQIWKPVIGAINGWAAGAGFHVMLTSTDIRIACEEHAQFKFALLSQEWVGGGPGGGGGGGGIFDTADRPCRRHEDIAYRRALWRQRSTEDQLDQRSCDDPF